MNDEPRDRELDWMRPHWKGLRAPASTDSVVMAAYHGRLGALRSMRRFWFPLAAAALAASLAVVLSNVHPADMSYRPVAQPRIIDLSQGERP